jgi:hypothetical protein
MMEAFDSLPSHPLKRSDVGRLRAHESVAQFISLEPQSVYLDGGLRRAVGLADETVVDLSFEDGAWKQTVLARGADKQDHLHETLGQIDED